MLSGFHLHQYTIHTIHLPIIRITEMNDETIFVIFICAIDTQIITNKADDIVCTIHVDCLACWLSKSIYTYAIYMIHESQYQSCMNNIVISELGQPAHQSMVTRIIIWRFFRFGMYLHYKEGKKWMAFAITISCMLHKFHSNWVLFSCWWHGMAEALRRDQYTILEVCEANLNSTLTSWTILKMSS